VKWRHSAQARIGMSYTLRSQFATARGSNRTHVPIRNDGIRPAAACLKIVTSDTQRKPASSLAVIARPIFSILSARDTTNHDAGLFEAVRFVLQNRCSLAIRNFFQGIGGAVRGRNLEARIPNLTEQPVPLAGGLLGQAGGLARLPALGVADRFGRPISPFLVMRVSKLTHKCSVYTVSLKMR